MVVTFVHISCECASVLRFFSPKSGNFFYLLISESRQEMRPVFAFFQLNSGERFVRKSTIANHSVAVTTLPPGIFMRWFWRLSAFCPNEAEGNADYFPIFVTVCCFCKDQLLNWTRGKSFDLFSDVLRNDKMNADAVFIRGLCLYYDDNIEKAVTFFTHALKLSPDHSEARSTLKVCVPEAVHLVEFSWSCAEKFALMLLIVRLFSLVWVHLFWNAALSKTSNWLEIFKNCVDVPRRVEVMVVWLWKP